MLVLLGLLIFIYHVGLGIMGHAMEPPPSFAFLYEAAFLCGVVWWLRDEAKSSPFKHLYCAGLLVGAAWPIIIPYHLVKTRGLRGLLPLLALIAIFVFARVAGFVIYLSLWGYD